MADKYRCKGCHKNVAATGQSPSPLRYRKHNRAPDDECPNSRTIIPAWIVKRGPEPDESDTPVIGRDYALCPECARMPTLDADGLFAKHIKNPGVPSAEREECPMSGKPYAPEGKECETTESPASGESRTAPTAPASTATAALPAASPARAEEEPTEAEQMLSKWATKVREIEDRDLPETEQSPESTPTRPALPPRPNAPEAPPSGAPPLSSATTAPVADAVATADPAEDAAPASVDASPSPQSSETPPDITALASIFPRSVRTPDSTAGSAGPTPADVPAVDRLVMTGHTCSMGGPPELNGHTFDCVLTLEEKPQFAQPGSPFSQPAKAPAVITDAVPMTVLAEQVVARMKELFYSYDNRRAADNRSAQSTLGPSEIGTPCDRRLAMSLLHVEPVNPGGDGWAAFVGTAIHAALADMFLWASGDTGRFAVETPLTFPNEHVPKGTSDLLDRTLFMVDDHKTQGRWSLDKLKTKGIPPGYRVQLHTYGLGQRLKGERVDYVALISWPRESSNLDDMYAVIERYDPEIARDALARVDRIAAEVKVHETERATWAGLDINAHRLGIAREFSVADDCRFCPFFAPGDATMERGCNGRA